jgi:hypothetical protein
MKRRKQQTVAMTVLELLLWNELMTPDNSNPDVFLKIIHHRIQRLGLKQMKGTEEQIRLWMAEEWPLCKELQSVIFERYLTKLADRGGGVIGRHGEFHISYRKNTKGESQFRVERILP